MSGRTQRDETPAIPVWLLSIAAGSMLLTLYLIFVWVSTEATMGIIQRIFYMHVPASIVSFLAVFVGGIASILYLKTNDPSYDDLAVAANESVLIFASVNMFLGSIWGRRVWGIWWTWDARLTTSFILLLIYIGYLVVRHAIPINQRAKLCSVICILGMVDVPIIYLSNRIFRTQHPSPVLFGGKDSGLAPDMLLVFAVAIFTMTMLWWCILKVRRRVARLERYLEVLGQSAYTNYMQ